MVWILIRELHRIYPGSEGNGIKYNVKSYACMHTCVSIHNRALKEYSYVLLFLTNASRNCSGPICINGVARVLKKLRTSKGDYWIKHWVSSVASLSILGTLFKERIGFQRERILPF